MSEPERRGTERLLLEVPIRVIAFGASGGGFTEDTHTVSLNRAGARIALKHRVASGDTLRIINLETFSEADFRVVGPTRLDSGEVAEWGVECTEPGRNIWGIEFAAPIGAESSHAGALLVCQGCGKQVVCVLTLMDVEILDATGVLQRLCDQCGQFSSWTYADVERSSPASAPGGAGGSCTSLRAGGSPAPSRGTERANREARAQAGAPEAPGSGSHSPRGTGAR